MLISYLCLIKAISIKKIFFYNVKNREKFSYYKGNNDFLTFSFNKI